MANLQTVLQIERDVSRIRAAAGVPEHMRSRIEPLLRNALSLAAKSKEAIDAGDTSGIASKTAMLARNYVNAAIKKVDDALHSVNIMHLAQRMEAERADSEARRKRATGREKLTERQQASALKLVASGKTYKEVAKALHTTARVEVSEKYIQRLVAKQPKN